MQSGQLAQIPVAQQITTRDGEEATLVTEIANKYRARQMDSFKYVGTTPKDWVMCEIKGIMMMGNVQFDVPNYPVVNPFTDRLSADELQSLMTYLKEVAKDGWCAVCELCGHLIKYPYPIKSGSHKLVMYVGSECVNNFMGAGYTFKQIKIFRETQLRKAFNEWIESAAVFCGNQKVRPEVIITFNPTEKPNVVTCSACGTRVLNEEQIRFGHTRTCKNQTPYWQMQRIKDKYYQYRAHLWKMDVKRASSRKMLNMLFNARSLRIPLTESLTQALEMDDRAREIRQAKSAMKSIKEN